MKNLKFKKQGLILTGLIFLIILMLNFISGFVFFRFDLTTDKRYTLTPSTVTMLNNLDDVVFIKIYLDGDLPVGFKRLKNAVKETLDEFRVYSKENIQYEFINPSESSDKNTRSEIYRQLYNKGLNPVNLEDKDDEGGVTKKIIYPGALISFRNEEIPVNFLKNNQAHSAEQNLNNSIQDIEYEFLNGIKKASLKEKKSIAFIEGHGELNKYEVEDAAIALLDFFKVKRVRLNGLLGSLKDFDAIIIAKPDSGFSDKDKFIIDQFIMRGGRVLWLLDNVNVTMDSLSSTNNTMAMIQELGLGEMLFKYGCRINYDLVQDIQCAQIPINTAIAGTPPQWTPSPWPYFPVLISLSQHPVVKNLNVIRTEFLSSIDTVGEDPDIKKEILLTTSKYSKSFSAPVRVSLDLLKQKPDIREFSSSNIPICVLLEGKFTSFFKNYEQILPQEFLESKDIGYKNKGEYSRMIVFSDGDIIKNLVRKKEDKFFSMPLGTDPWFSKIFYAGNKEFIINAMNYLLDEDGTMLVRTRELELRLLDKAKVNEQKYSWQALNILLPVLIIIDNY